MSAVANDPLTIIQGDALSSLRELPDESVQCVVTSPPYWGLRDYGVAPIVWDNHNGCEHEWSQYLQPSANGQTTHAMIAETLNESSATRKPKLSEFCKCGAWRGCFGLEPTPEMYAQHAVEIFREVRRVLRKDGTCWLNLGDSYFGANWRGSEAIGTKQATNRGAKASQHSMNPQEWRNMRHTNLKPKDLVGIPWMVAFALRADGWYLRSDVIWAKPNPMPESVTDRPTRSHEYIFLLSKGQKYFYNAEAIAEALLRPDEGERQTPARFGGANKWHEAQKQSRLHSGNEYLGTANGTRNKRSVWPIATNPYPDAHFATFPTEIPRLCILAGTKAGDVVLDPFAGSGTTAKVAIELGRKAILIEPKLEYVRMIEKRCRTTIGLPLSFESDACKDDKMSA